MLYTVCSVLSWAGRIIAFFLYCIAGNIRERFILANWKKFAKIKTCQLLLYIAYTVCRATGLKNRQTRPNF